MEHTLADLRRPDNAFSEERSENSCRLLQRKHRSLLCSHLQSQLAYASYKAMTLESVCDPDEGERRRLLLYKFGEQKNWTEALSS